MARLWNKIKQHPELTFCQKGLLTLKKQLTIKYDQLPLSSKYFNIS